MQIIKEGYKFLLMSLFLLFPNACFAQKEFNSWVFTDDCSLIFNGGAAFGKYNTQSNAGRR